MPQLFTYQTRIANHQELDAYAALYGKVERRLFADVMSGKQAASLKRDYLKRFNIPARMFNSIRMGLEGKIRSVKELQKDRVMELQARIKKAEKVIKRLEKKSESNQVHQKKRRLTILVAKLENLQNDILSGKVHIAFGSKKLWHKQFNLIKNGYESHEQWLADWQSARNSEIYIVGSEDEAGGCQLCTASIGEEGINLRLRLPGALVDKDKYLNIEGINFSYGEEKILSAIDNNRQYNAIKKRLNDKSARASGYGQAITYRFKRDNKGWKVFVSTEVQRAEVVTHNAYGAIGVDLNADHLACTETDRFGNPIKSWSVPLHTYGKTTDQATAIIGGAVNTITDYAQDKRKPVVIEKLDFSQKKAELEKASRKMARMLSSLNYSKTKTMLKASAYRKGVVVNQVNPAYSSVIGRVKYAKRYGLTVHQAAALVIAQRILGVSERLPKHREAPDGKGGHVTFCVSERNRMKHVWSQWASVSKSLKSALAAQYRSAKADPVTASAATEIYSILTGEIPVRESSEPLFV